MVGVKRAFATMALLTLVVALFLQSSNGAENTSDPPKQKPPAAIEWASVTVNTPRLRGFTIDYPKGWTERPSSANATDCLPVASSTKSITWTGSSSSTG